jgi:2-polyprenyl-6-methoxyphenol hydroxylase-like FAD-dependent oxidoreductase
MNGHALVIGGGIGGLLAARVLAARFERVTVLERHCYPTDSGSLAPPSRRGVPQSRCLHLLMAAGAVAFDELTPGWREELIAGGAVPFDASADAAVHFPSGWLPRTPSGITTYACSRALLENVLRRGCAGNPRVRVLEDQRVIGLLGTDRGDRVTGVRTAGATGSGEVTIAADLVVDASGRGSTLPDWIERMSDGLEVEESVVESGMSYVSCWFHLEPGDAPDWQCLSIAPQAGTASRTAMMLRAEYDRWGVVLLTPAGEQLPSDDQAFLAFTAGLGDGKLRDALARATPVSAIQHYGSAPNRMRHYDRLTDWPEGLVALGDSVCALDPYVGLGMTVAARGAVLLGRWLEQERATVDGLEFQEQLACVNAEPWRLATGCNAEGEPMARHGDHEHLGRLYEAAPKSAEIAHALLAVQHLLRPMDTLMDLYPQ